MKRREFVTLLSGAAAWTFAASAQDSAVPLIGFLNSASPGPFARLADAFRQGLREGGYVEGRNVTIEYRWADGQFARLPDLAAELVHRRVSLIVAAGGTVSARAAKEATTTIPILFIVGPNPIGDSLVTSVSRPGGNATGVALYTSELLPKRLELLEKLLPRAAKIAVLVNPSDAPPRRRPRRSRSCSPAVTIRSRSASSTISIVPAATSPAPPNARLISMSRNTGLPHCSAARVHAAAWSS